MDIFRDLEEVPPSYGPAVVSVGNFDGVHRGHQAIIAELQRRARELAGKAVVVTFEPHPARILRPGSKFKLITPTSVKLGLLARTGIDAVLLLPFSRELSMMSPRSFVKHVLVDCLRAREVHEGFNFRFGHKAKGDTTLLEELGREFGFQVRVHPALRIRGDMVSSSRVRELLEQGDVSRVRHLLGRPFAISQTPERGRGYGHQYTVPTINLSRYEEAVPANGVYITRTGVAGDCFDSVTNVGTRPTFGDESFAIETHLLNFHEVDLSPERPVEISFLKRLRPEIKFASVEGLREQIARDVRRARRYFHLLALARNAGSSIRSGLS